MLPLHDLNVPASGAHIHPDQLDGAHSIRERASRLLTLGYDVIAFTHTPAVPGRLTDADRCTLKALPTSSLASASRQATAAVAHRSRNILATPSLVPVSAGAVLACDPRTEQAAGSTKMMEPLQQLTRLNYQASDAVQAQVLANTPQVTSTYDLVAIEPGSERVLQQACSSLDVDLITLDLSQRLPFRMRPAVLKPAIGRGIMFEVCYSRAVTNEDARRQFLSNAQALARCLRGKNVVISSGAVAALQLRAPAELCAAMSLLLGVSLQQAWHAITCNPHCAVVHGAARRARAQMAASSGGTHSVSVIAVGVGGNTNTAAPQPNSSAAAAPAGTSKAAAKAARALVAQQKQRFKQNLAVVGKRKRGAVSGTVAAHPGVIITEPAAGQGQLAMDVD